MYIKEVKKRNGKTDKMYKYLHLVETIRTEKGPRQRLILNLGVLDISPEHYKDLANAIEGMLTGQTSLFDNQPPIINEYAQEATSKILTKKSNKKAASDNNQETEQEETEKVNVNSVKISKSRSIGAEHVCHSYWKRLEIDKFLEEETEISKSLHPLIESLVLGRLISPGSELHTYQWAEKRSGIYDLLKTPARYSSRSYYRAADKLYAYKKELESHLNKREKTLFSLNEKLCFFDLTNTFLEGEANGNSKAKRGHSKEKRSDCKLLTLALIVDEDGFAKHSHLYKGNQYEAYTLPEMISDLVKENPMSSNDRTVVMDTGIATDENISYLKGNGFHYIVVNKGSSIFDDKDIEDLKAIRVNKDNDVEVEITRKEKGDEVFVLCRSEGRRKKEEAIRNRQEDLFIKRIEYLREGLNKKGRMKNFTKITESIGRLREKYPKASKSFDITVEPENVNKETHKLNALNIEINRKEPSIDIKNNDGFYVLKSDRIELEDEEIWETYVMLTRIENSFRTIKSSLGLRPVFHQKDDTSDAHMFISVIAYHILHAIEYTMKQNGDHRSWATLRDSLSTHQFVTMEYDKYNETDNKKEHKYINMCTNPEQEHLDIYKKLSIEKTPIKRMKISSDEFF